MCGHISLNFTDLKAPVVNKFSLKFLYSIIGNFNESCNLPQGRPQIVRLKTGYYLLICVFISNVEIRRVKMDAETKQVSTWLYPVYHAGSTRDVCSMMLVESLNITSDLGK